MELILYVILPKIFHQYPQYPHQIAKQKKHLNYSISCFKNRISIFNFIKKYTIFQSSNMIQTNRQMLIIQNKIQHRVRVSEGNKGHFELSNLNEKKRQRCKGRERENARSGCVFWSHICKVPGSQPLYSFLSAKRMLPYCPGISAA